MKTSLKILTLFTCSSLTVIGTQTFAQTTVQVDPSLNWIGYMNVSSLPADGGGYIFGNTWGTGDLRASFSGGVLTLAPCVNVWETTDTYWVKADGVSPNKQMDANMYVENDALAGQTITFTGATTLNTLASGYTDVAFIKDFVPNYSSSTSTTIALLPGQQFSITLATLAGDHIQFGFEMIGPDANPATAASLGMVQIAAVPEPGTLALLGLGGIAVLTWRRRH